MDLEPIFMLGGIPAYDAARIVCPAFFRSLQNVLTSGIIDEPGKIFDIRRSRSYSAREGSIKALW